MTQGERLARIETLIEEKVLTEITGLRDDVRAIRKELDDDVADLARLKAKGSGILIGVAMAGAAIGAGASSLWRWLVDLIT